MLTFKRTFFFTFFAGLALGAAFLGGYLLHAYQQSQAATFPIFDEAYRLVDQHGYTPLPTPRALEYGMIRGMLQAYGDPHTSFLEPPQAELANDSLEGRYGGVGMRMAKDAGENWLLYPFPDGPAAKAGIQENDRLLGVESLQVSGQTPADQIEAAIRGPVGKVVHIRFAHPPDYAPLEAAIQREEIPLPSVTWHLDAGEPRLGVIEANIIASTTAEEITKAVKDLQSRGATAFALDLRNNGGGLLDAGIAIARLFLRDGVVIEQQFRGEAVKTYSVEKPGELADIPLVVLVNGGTASACEIIAGALQVHGRAKLIGEPTYGKNTIQLIFELGDKSSLHVTAAQWWIPGLDAPRPGKGLTPDIAVAPGGPPDPFIQAAIQTLLQP